VGTLLDDRGRENVRIYGLLVVEVAAGAVPLEAVPDMEVLLEVVTQRRVDSRPFLSSALRAFEDLGAMPWADRAGQELQATGETVHRREADVMDELTPQERQIAQLLAKGRTTREAAASLFISPKTVEYHLRHVYLKLDIRSCAALAERFGDG